MTEELKQQLLSFLLNVEKTMRAYNYALTATKYIDPNDHLKNIQKINSMSSELKKRVEQL